MRIPLVLLLVVCSLADARLSAQALVPSAEVPVSDPVLAAAPLEQTPVASDSNGEIALAVWNDNRSGATAAYAARIDDDGLVLDRVGIHLGDGIPRTVVWTGTEFLVVLEHTGRHEMILVDVNGTIVRRSMVDAGERFAAALDGDVIRLLFLTTEPTSGGVTYLRGHFVNPLPELPVIRQIALPAAPTGYTDVEWLAGSDGNNLLVLRLQRANAGAGPDRVVAERISEDGEHLSSTDTGPFAFDSRDRLRGNSQGYVLVTQSDGNDPVVRSYALAPSGAYSGQTDTLATPAPQVADIALERDGPGYVLVWAPNVFQTRSFTHAASVAADATFGTLRVIGDWQGTQSGVAVATAGNHRVVLQGIRQRFGSTSYDVYSTQLNADLSARTPELVTQSSAIQSGVRVAASKNGYLVTWVENGPDLVVRTYARRFSTTGVPIDPSPVEIFAFEDEANVLRLPKARVAASANAYVVVWRTEAGLFARRMSAAGAGWLDAQPAQIAPAANHFDVTSNGTDALAVWTGPCGQSLHCVMSRRLPMSGPMDAGLQHVVSNSAFAHDVTAGTDGRDYLVAWSEGRRQCSITCGLDPFSILAARVRADGSPVDAQPLVLEDRQTDAQNPVVAFDGQQYVVLWSAWSNGWTVRGVRVTPGGTVLEKDGRAGTVVDREVGPASVQPVLARLDQHFVLFNRVAVVVDGRNAVRWTATTFPLTFPLSEVAALPRQTFVHHDSQQFASLHATTSPAGVLHVGYDRVAHGVFGGVSRAFVSRFGQDTPPGRRRAVSR